MVGSRLGRRSRTNLREGNALHFLSTTTSSRTRNTARIRNTAEKAEKTSKINVDSSTSASSTTTTSKQTHFGFQSVDMNEKESMVRGVFDSVAESYDVMNDLMSGTLHRMWKDHFVSMLGQQFLTPAAAVSMEEDSSPLSSAPAAAASMEESSSSSSASFEMEEEEEGDEEEDGYGFDGEEEDPVRILDVAGGTGDIAFRMSDAKILADERAGYGEEYAPLEVTVFDINPSMLDVGRRRSMSRPPTAGSVSLDWVEGNAEKLPFDDDVFDAYTIAFGIRNVTNISVALEEAHRVLRPGGRFLCLEFSRVENPMLRAAYTAYSFNVIPEIGNLVAGDRDSYKYLVESIARFPNQENFRTMIEDAGFKGTSYVNLTGGIVAIHSGFKL